MPDFKKYQEKLEGLLSLGWKIEVIERGAVFDVIEGTYILGEWRINGHNHKIDKRFTIAGGKELELNDTLIEAVARQVASETHSPIDGE